MHTSLPTWSAAPSRAAGTAYVGRQWALGFDLCITDVDCPPFQRCCAGVCIAPDESACTSCGQGCGEGQSCCLSLAHPSGWDCFEQDSDTRCRCVDCTDSGENCCPTPDPATPFACTNLSSDRKNCGACGNECTEGKPCCGGVCCATGACRLNSDGVTCCPADKVCKHDGIAVCCGSGEACDFDTGVCRTTCNICETLDQHGECVPSPGAKPCGGTPDRPAACCGDCQTCDYDDNGELKCRNCDSGICEICVAGQCEQSCDSHQICDYDTGVCRDCGPCEEVSDGDCRTRCDPCEDCVNGECVTRCGSCQTCDHDTGTCRNCGVCERCVNGECELESNSCGSCQVCDEKAGGCRNCNSCERCDAGVCEKDFRRYPCGDTCCGPCEYCDFETQTCQGCEELRCGYCEDGQCNVRFACDEQGHICCDHCCLYRGDGTISCCDDEPHESGQSLARVQPFSDWESPSVLAPTSNTRRLNAVVRWRRTRASMI